MTTPNHSYWIATNTGKIIDLLKPDPEQITIEDIANNLANICRFNGQLQQWYSVAEHSIHVAELVPTEYKLHALLHDATEAYICDVPTPLKRLLGTAYSSIEGRMAAAIGLRFGIELNHLPEPVLQADRVMVVTERDALQVSPMEWGREYEDSLRYPDFRRKYTNPGEARTAFLDAYRQYSDL